MPLHVKLIPHVGLFLFYHVLPYIILVCPAKRDQCLVLDHETRGGRAATALHTHPRAGSGVALVGTQPRWIKRE